MVPLAVPTEGVVGLHLVLGLDPFTDGLQPETARHGQDRLSNGGARGRVIDARDGIQPHDRPDR